MSSRRPGRRAAAMLAALVLSLAAVALAQLSALPGAAGAAPSGAGAPPAAAQASGRALSLDGQTQWVEPSPTGPSIFELTLRAPGAAPTDRLRAVVYTRLINRSTFERVEKTGPQHADSELTRTVPVSLSSLPADPTDHGAVDFSVAVVTHSSASTPSSARLNLQCATRTGTEGAATCPGVYPVQVTLRRADGTPVGQLTTFLTFAAGKSAHPLELAWVVPLAAPIHLDTASRPPLQAVAPLPASEVADLSTLASQLHAHPNVPVTLEPSPQTLQALRASGATGSAAVSAVAQMSADQSVDEIPPQPYVPVDLQTLAAAGEPTEIVAQMAAGATTLRSLHVSTSATRAGTWVASTGGPALLTGLVQVGATHLVVPGTSLQSDATPTSGTFASQFSVEGKGTAPAATLAVAEADGHLTSELSRSADPALAASRLLADLAMVHFEVPNTPAVRGMVAVPPPGWRPDTAFDRVLLAGLQGNPDVVPVTLDRFFSTVTPPRSTPRGGAGTRRFKPTAARDAMTLGPATATAISRARLRLSAFDDATSPSQLPGHTRHRTIQAKLGDLLLATERAGVPGRVVAAGVSLVERALAAQLAGIAFSVAQTVTLTARTGFIPITLVSHLPYHVTGVLTVKSSRFVFPGSRAHGSVSHRMVLDHLTNSWKVDVMARSSGEMPLDLTFTSANGTLVFATGQLNVRSTATSVVGVVLTVVALVVLLAWWARTWRSGRRRRRVRPAR